MGINGVPHRSHGGTWLLVGTGYLGCALIAWPRHLIEQVRVALAESLLGPWRGEVSVDSVPRPTITLSLPVHDQASTHQRPLAGNPTRRPVAPQLT